MLLQLSLISIMTVEILTIYFGLFVIKSSRLDRLALATGLALIWWMEGRGQDR
jgi:hypothetical protein